MRISLTVLLLMLAILPVAAKESQFKVRALWADPSSFSTREKADVLLDRCRRARINLLLPDVMLHGGLYHKSSHYLHKVYATDEYDPLAYLTEKAHAQGMEVHAWYCVYYDGTEALKTVKPEWLCTDIDGKPMDQGYFLSPQVPGVNDYLLSVMKDGLAYDIDGIHLDYIRYYGSGYDYSDLGRERFIETHGFDPKDFLDHGERIVPDEPFPVRVMRPERHKTRIWEATWTESLMDRAGLGFAFISEKPENVDALRAPGLLVLCVVYNVSPEMTQAIERYVERGGSVICIDGLSAKADPRLFKLFGVKPGSTWLATDWRSIEAEGSHPLTKCLPRESLKVNANCPPGLDGGKVVARFDTGEPAVIVNGRTTLVCFNPCTPNTGGPSLMVRGIVEWLRSESARSGRASVPAISPDRPAQRRGHYNAESDADPMRARRWEWIQYKCRSITDLVRGVHEAVKAKSPGLMVSAAGGFSFGEQYLIFRDGQSWLTEGLLDFVCPMDYVDDIRDLHRASVPPDQLATFYPGLSLYTSKTVGGKKTTVSQDAKVVREQLDLLRREGYRGFTLFCSAQLTDAQIKVIAAAAGTPE
jgi:uncharacterized lipoprotein YddW (UPF0748 family)